MGRRPGFGSIERLASGRFRARYPGPDGRRYTAPTTFVTKSEARGWLSLQHAEITRKAWAPPQTVPTVVTFGGYAEQWLAQRDLKPRTREHYRKLLDQHLLAAFGPAALTSITPESVRSWHAGIGTKTPTLRAHCYGLLRTILATAVSDGLLVGQPVPHQGSRDHQEGHLHPAPDRARAGEAHSGDARAVPGDDPAGVLVRAALRRADRATAPRRRHRHGRRSGCDPRRAWGGAHR